ncbi:hypothetical protein B484DRAFT_427490, partial [Ochromonadaceae sp. CCMP2298]
VEKSLFAKIRAGCYEFHTKYWDKVSEDAKDLVRRLLVVDPSCRLTADEALAHPWVAADSKTLSSYDLSSSLSELELPHAPANAGGIAAGSISAELREEMEQMQLTGEMQEMGEMQEVGEMQQMEGHRDPQSKKK